MQSNPIQSKVSSFHSNDLIFSIEYLSSHWLHEALQLQEVGINYVLESLVLSEERSLEHREKIVRLTTEVTTLSQKSATNISDEKLQSSSAATDGLRS